MAENLNLNSMKISADQIDTKAYAGKNGNGDPIVYIASKGGLHALFCKNKEGNVESLAAAPHKAIALWMAEQKDPKLVWDKDFVSDGEDRLARSERERFDRLRKIMLTPTTLAKSEKIPSNRYFIYNVKEKWIEHATKEDLIKSIESGRVDKFCLVRNFALIEPVYTVESHPEFKDVRAECKTEET
jgi:hypothetical protein